MWGCPNNSSIIDRWLNGFLTAVQIMVSWSWLLCLQVTGLSPAFRWRGIQMKQMHIWLYIQMMDESKTNTHLFTQVIKTNWNYPGTSIIYGCFLDYGHFWPCGLSENKHFFYTFFTLFFFYGHTCITGKVCHLFF